MGYLPRSAWRARARRSSPGRLVSSYVQGLAFHWPGHGRPIPKDGIARALRGWQDYHMDHQGWSDIAYQVAVDQWGRKWTLRGLENRSAANGGTVENGTHGAVLLILAAGEKPSPAMLQATRGVVADFRRRFPGANELAGHGDVRRAGPTECPGPLIRAAIKAGDFEPDGKEIDVNERELRTIIREELDREAGKAWRTHQLIRALVREHGMSPVKILAAARRERKAASREAKR